MSVHDAEQRLAGALARKMGRIPVKLIMKETCPDCGAVHRTDWDREEHYRFCPGPIRLRFTNDGIYGEYGDE